jgi:hypothetical protein
MLPSGSGQGKREGRSLADSTFCPDSPTMPVHDPLNGGKTNPRPFELAQAV